MPLTDKQALIVLAKKIATNFKLDPVLICAMVEQESNWNPWAMRFEPFFFNRYVSSQYTNNKISASEAWARGYSWGLLQVMGQTARENGFDMLFLSALCDPEAGLSIGCSVFAKKLDAAKGEVNKALLAWNGGANAAYPAQVMARKPHYL